MEQVMIYKMRNKGGHEVLCKINTLSGWEHKGYKLVGSQYFPVSVSMLDLSTDAIPDNLEGYHPLEQASSSERFKRFKPKYVNGRKPRR